MKPARKSKPRHSQTAKCYAHYLADLKRKAPFERMLIEQGYSFHAPNMFCDDNQDMQTFFLHTTKDGIRLVMPTYGDLSDIEPADAQVFMTLMNGTAMVTRFFIGDGFIQAEALYHGKFNPKKFMEFLKHWRADIEPIMVKDSAVKHWHMSRKRR